ncbi:uncharacterized protein LOC143210562 [Lasioglossum baleicum]|uniref:uncharacterized protein LOC143210562 n=1 Tax=Lasioglossum baleicum TaxID=434251 RepID=UPI003FCC7415
MGATEKRYDNKRRLITAHVHSLLNLPCAVVENKTALSDIRQRVNMSVLALQGLGCSIQSWDELLVCLVVNCLDETSRRDWEFELGTSTEFPTFQKLDDFLESRIRSLEALSRTTSQASIPTARSSTARSGPTRSAQSHTTMQTDRSCPLCKADHPLHRCKTFRDKTISQRFEYVKQGSRCINCLSAKHNTRSCPSSYTCHTCKKRHHTLLHFDNAVKSETEREACLASTTSDANAMRIPSHSVLQTTALSAHILLATARIDVHSSSNRTQRVRALLDQGSVVSIINENLAQRLRTPRSRVSISITGVGDGETRCTAATTLTIASTRRTESTYSTNALIVKSLLNYLPHRVTGNFNLEYIRGLDLADDIPFSQDPIEMIIGADVYGSLLLDGVRKGDSNQPVAQNTTLGWILSGPLPNPPLQPLREVQTFHTITSDALDLALREFWEIEELPAQTHVTPAETECENHFVATHTRTTTGQYCVRLPFVQEPPIGIGSSFPASKVMWSRQEQRIISNPKLAAEYSAFMKEYHDLGHMIEICDPEPISSQTVYIPHHAVIRDTSATTRLRVVFNASCKSSNGTSLNDHLLVGPKLQTELPAVVLRWRMHRYVYIADITKMYRQILVDERDVDYQRIIWRPTPAEPIRHYQLRTVTYGTAPAPYLALRVLKQLALDDGSKYPLACSILKSQIYVDDCLFGADEKELARHTRDQLISLLKGAGLHLRKWASNSAVLMSDSDPTDHGLAGGKTLQPDDSLKVLGVAWNPETDSFRFDVTLENTAPQSKRAILSTIAKLFDPLGWVTPVVITAKIIMQELWRLNCEWDACIPSEIHAVWTAYFKQLPCLRQISLPRWINLGSSALSVELHGFADASNRAYAAVIYLRVTMQNGEVAVSLLTAKSKVAPVKSLSIPRLELCAATLLARLMSFIRTTLDLHNSPVYCWTDSTIVLAWIAQTPSRWKVFVANRVAEIQSKVPTAQWNHVPTDHNPADCASRGFDASMFSQHSLWWAGPDWLKDPSSCWPRETPPLKPSAELEERPAVSAHTITPGEVWDLATRFSQWSRLIRVTAYMCRFIARLRKITRRDDSLIPSRQALTTEEIQRARIFWLKYIQRSRYPSEVDCLRNRQPLPRGSPLLPLNVFFDNNDLIRVGGRLRNAEMLENTKHPIVLASHPLVNLLISSIHIRSLHAGPQLTLSTLRQEFWLPRARPIIRAVLHRCVPCTREQAAIASELMGDLPAPRVNRAERAFLHTGVDYAGPVLVRTTAGRGYKARKSYIALFICLTTRAIHLELVSDYSTAAFLACFDRFCSRRDLPHIMYSDNGTTFQGADKEIA